MLNKHHMCLLAASISSWLTGPLSSIITTIRAHESERSLPPFAAMWRKSEAVKTGRLWSWWNALLMRLL